MKLPSFLKILLFTLFLGLVGCKRVSPQTANATNSTQSLGAPAPAAAIVTVDAKAPIIAFDLQGYLDQKLAAGEKTIVVPPGRYRVTPKNRVHLKLENLQDVKIIATGVQMICTETTLEVEIKNCRNLTLSGLTIDYDPLPFTQGRITALAPDKSWIEFKILDGYPENLEQRIEIFDRTSELLKTRTIYNWQPFQKLGNGHYRVAKPIDHAFNPAIGLEEVGDILVTNSVYTPGGFAPHAIFSDHCTDLVLEDITIYASNCFSFLEYHCDKSTYRRCRVERCPPEFDLVKREVRRLRSGNADAFHSKHAKRGPQILGCTAKFMGDDAVNICGEYYMALGTSDREVRVVAPKGMNIRTGHMVELYSYSGLRLPDARVESVVADGSVRPDEIAFIQDQKMDSRLLERLSAPSAKTWLITLDREVDFPRGSAIASTQHTGNGFLVKDNDFGFNRSRGILIKGSHGEVVGNTITASWMAAILVAPEWYWLESGSASDVVIRDNLIDRCRQTAIRVVALGGKGEIAPAGAHQNITIRDNRIQQSPPPYIEVNSTKGLVLGGNQYPANALATAENPMARPAPLKLVNCSEVTAE